MPLEIGMTVSGEIIDVAADGILVCLPEGATGRVLPSECPPLERLSSRFCIGGRITVRIVAQGEDGRFDLSILSSQERRSADTFDREFHRLHYVLNRRPAKAAPTAWMKRDQLVEERIEKWSKRVGEGLSRLRKHRGERLSEEFYDEDGGLHAKRDPHHR